MSKTARNGAVPIDIEVTVSGAERIKELEEYAKFLFEKVTLGSELDQEIEGAESNGR